MKIEETEMTGRGMFVLPETTVLALLGCFDLMATIYFLGTGQAREANPFMQNVLLQAGPRGFVLVKALFLAGPLAIMEIARRERPDFVRKALRFAIVAYAAMLFVAYYRR
jgi:hypothetical protein